MEPHTRRPYFLMIMLVPSQRQVLVEVKIHTVICLLVITRATGTELVTILTSLIIPLIKERYF